MENTRKYKVVIIAPTCFYYQVELFRELAIAERIDLSVVFCSDEVNSGKDVKIAYGVDQDWGTEDDLLNGYAYRFLRNYSPWGSYLKSLVGLANFGIWKEISSARPDAGAAGGRAARGARGSRRRPRRSPAPAGRAGETADHGGQRPSSDLDRAISAHQ